MSGILKNLNKKRDYFIAVLVCALTTIVASPLRQVLDLANIVMLFLIVVFLVSLKLGRGPAVMSAFLAVALFDFYFVPPRMSFAVHDVQYLVTFVVMLGVGVATAHLTAMLGKQKEAAIEREQQTHRLYELARELAGIISLNQVSEALSHYLLGYERNATIHLLDSDGKLLSLLQDVPLNILAEMAIQQAKLTEAGHLSNNSQNTLVFPLISPSGVRGVLVITVAYGLEDIDKTQLQAVANLVAIAIERLHYVDISQKIQIEATTERLRSSILSALSHDLRTPLTGLVGMIDALALNIDSMNVLMSNAAIAIRNQARAMCQLVDKLLDMARLHAGEVRLQKDWRLFEDVIGSAIKLLKPSLTDHPIKVSLTPSLPLVEFDDVLIERVICNLIQNAAKYSQKNQPIEIRGFVDGNVACVEVRDHGRGFLTDQTDTLFQMFTRGNTESSVHGVGLGLAICKAIVDAHDGTIKAYNHQDGGACVSLCLPIGNPPEISAEAGG